MIYLGVDPGQKGALAVIWDGGSYAAWPWTTPRDMTALVAEVCLVTVRSHQVQVDTQCLATIERSAGFPGMAKSSIAKLQNNLGIWEGIVVALGVPYEFVAPGKWQRALGCLSKGDKNVTKRKAQELFPRLKITHKIADALLIAEYCKRECGKRMRGG